MNTTKAEVLQLLDKFISQRSGIDFRNYGDRQSAMGDYNRILRDGREARTLLRAVEWSDVTVDGLIDAFRAFSGRLSISQEGEETRLDYCTGQYFPTEYRAAACAVLASALWDYYRPDYKDADNAGDKLRAMFKRKFGRGIASRWFD